ncbi:proprotein convertase subtilisin/kexin type 5-like, partial [Nannospalax galili]|uniref:proprotein convertase subtilisin/kexin type 5-like n=1 Tax=Nannospalax galili TaxID=1026970 RepID=UPI00111C8873
MCQDCIHEKTCKECMADFFLYDDTCHKSCPQHFYPDLGHCVPCHENCLMCSGPKEDDCEVCAEASKVLYNGLCLDTCPAGTYYEEETDDCKECQKFCQTCISSWTCLACQEGLTMVHETCMPKECASMEYWDEGAHRCQPCHRKCSRCSGPAEDQCYTCPGDSFLLNTTCVKDCPEDSISKPISSVMGILQQQSPALTPV